MLNRTGHFWEQRYHSSSFATSDHDRALATLRYIHANPIAAGIRRGFHYRYSNYGTYANLTDDGLTDWHPAFLALGSSLDECAAKYQAYCNGKEFATYTPKRKTGGRKSHWGKKQLPDTSRRRPDKRPAPNQLPLQGVQRCQVSTIAGLPEMVEMVVIRFVRANVRQNFEVI